MHYSPRMTELKGLAVIDVEGSALNTNTNNHESDHKTAYPPPPSAFCTPPRAFCFSFSLFFPLDHSGSAVDCRPAARLPQWLQALNGYGSWGFCISFKLRLDHSFSETILTASPHANLPFLPPQSSECTLFRHSKRFKSTRLYCTVLNFRL